MSLRERRESLDPFEVLVRESLSEETAGKVPGPEVRAELLQRAARLQKHEASPGSVSFRGLFNDGQSRFAQSTSSHHFVCLEALFGARTSWFSFNQLAR
jgi:hypothetical protein